MLFIDISSCLFLKLKNILYKVLNQLKTMYHINNEDYKWSPDQFEFPVLSSKDNKKKNRFNIENKIFNKEQGCI